MTTQRSEAHGDVWIVEWQCIGGDMEQEEFSTLTAANKFYDELMDSEDDFEFINEPWLAEGADEKFIKGKTMKSESIEDLRDRSVSSGTLKSEDLIPKFLGVLKTYGKDKYDKYIKENPEVEDWKNLDEETMGWVVDELTDLLNEIAPDGCYFGASDGDGADFGFWSMSNESKKSEVAEGSDYYVIVFTSNEDAVKGAEYARNLGEDPLLPPGGKAVYVYGNDRDALKAFGKKWFDICVDDDLGTTSTFGLNAKDESKKSEADGNKDIFTLDLTRIDADGDEEGLDDMQAAQTFYDEDDAIKAAKELADSYKDDDGVVQVIVMAGEQEKPNGDIVGEPFDIFTASSSDSATTAKYREKAGYTKTDGLDYYAKGGTSEAKKSEAYNWIAFYFCKDKRTGTEYAIIPQDRVFVVGNGGGRYNLSYLDANGHWDRLSYGYFATSCEPISDPENSKVYAVVKADEDRRIIALTESEFDTIVEADDAVKMVRTIVANNYESKKSEGNDDDKDCKGKDCKDDKTKKNEADATFKVGDFVNYDAESDGKDVYDSFIPCEVVDVNDDGTLGLCVYGSYVNEEGLGENASASCCSKLDHYAGMVDANHYYMDGKYNAYKGGWEILITDKELNPKVYEFIGTIDDLSEVLDIDDFYGGENFVFDEDLKDEVANNTGWDVETTTFADMTGDVGESKKSEAKKKYYGYGKDDAIDKEDNDFMWQVAYDWFEDRLPEKLKREADSAVYKVIDMDSRAYEEIVTMDDYHAYLQKYGPSVIKDIKANDESKQTEGLPPKKLGNRLYRSRADLINKMKTLDAVEITTPAQFNDIHSKQWLHTAGYAMDINGNLVGQTYFGDKDGKWYYATTKTFQGDYLPECKEEAEKSEKASVTCSICGNPTDDPIWGEGNRAFCKDCYSDGDDFKHGKTKFVVGMMISLDGVKQYIRELKPRTFVGQSVDTGKEFSLPISSLNRASILYDPRNESKKSESLTLKQKELKDMARFGQAEDITTISDEEAKALRKKGIETIGVSRGTYGMNGALLRDNEGKKYVITARSSNLFYFV